ncbi:MAG: Mur ligase domain-containing protein [Desulfovibrio sp.]|jgi:UDP-N-acetylmuramoyl-tripeptide--D-alanyl-D-alanine ligase|nr:Mur ligase domain-containing protein [Desulfovibrio sp.]
MLLNFMETATALGCAPERILRGVRRCVGPADADYARGLTGTVTASTGAAGADAAGAFTGAATDSRQVMPGNIFFCIKGERVDGHDFALDAASAGAGAVVALRDPFPAGVRDAASGPDLPPVFLADDVEDALLRLAARHRESASATVIGLTGTAGKTTVKEVLARVLRERGRTERNPMNLNNGIGMPLSMLNAAPDARFWVMEAGVSKVGDMEELARALRPDAALILNVGDGHAEGLGKGGAATEKARLLDFIQPGGTALVSGDYPELDKECAARSAAFAARNVRCLRFSAHNADVWCRARYLGPAEQAALTGSLRGRYAVCAGDVEFVCEAPFFDTCAGAFGAENAAAVAALALGLGLEPDEICRGLAAAQTPAQRFAVRYFFLPGRGRYTLVDDSYNANPLSAGRVIPAAAEAAHGSGLPFVPVLGEMLELGEESPAAHERLGEIVAATRPAAVFWTGGQADCVRRGLHRGGLPGNLEELPARVEDFAARMEATGPALVLFKGSRANRLERWVEALLRKAGETARPDGHRADTRRGAGGAYGRNSRMRAKGDGRVL